MALLPHIPISFTLVLFSILSIFSHTVLADEVTLYTDTAPTTTSSLAAGQTYTGLPAYDPTRLTPPAPPSPAVTSLSLSIPSDGAGVASEGLSLSIPQKGNFLGFSIELSVATSLLGSSSGNLKVPFLNFMANIQNRAGAGPIIRVGGNSQEGSTIFVDGLEGGVAMEKIKVSSGVTDTPLINYSPELFYIMSNITSLVGAEWYFGLAFNESDVDSPTGNIPIAAHWAQEILGDSLLGLSVGNEPDLYVNHNHRSTGWGVSDFVTEYDDVVKSIVSNGSLLNNNAFIGPSLCCNVPGFEFSDLINAGWLEENVDRLSAVTVQHYPTNNCKVNGKVIEPQDIFSDFLNHTSAQALVGEYLADSVTVQNAGKELVMLETNTASCGGFAGLSDSFGAAMWLTDFALQMAYANFSTALMHVGGQNVYYNPFTPPPSKLSKTLQWTPGSVYYPTLVISEAFGKSNASRVVDLTPLPEYDANSIYHPVYAIYENDVVARMVLFNFIDDSTRGSDLDVTINIQNQSPTQVQVRYLQADSVSEQYDIYWANQTLGQSFASDGRLYGDLETITITCDEGVCIVPVPAPSVALVYLSDAALEESNVSEYATLTYPTSIIGSGSATVDVESLSTSNGKEGSGRGSTSKGVAKSSAGRRVEWMGGLLGLGLLLGAINI
ncbi:hypothetical protein C343_06306 [Cryptococcus neoformans C23]|uniref:Beta-glucuronidase C-terminal domain-containing protein n=1 Tax=Cryptococcus neoformans (strain H99 / ATCC 208821 / CBS 10515 / FGSC 9487) TaxID=235443 RepID=J9W043_CRYN9|nr:hypothetical protein CNAG_06104 [Cryptococcus neoformans var. grubii H99]AFR98329.1 hypothetical protein CNAG_06104 [Cryptococcus neoformans var. grubii H99]AUB28458.1 hypothetical protein CKF44_06104 [Cryptococcus neoformans var. grubii]OWZ27136.1 hypothetical protein C347_06306 [Cryptococcus neoformans var. grubii AD2-60a]OWZ39098.1 hypothetical protein C343_06306 [Cryptococcus neoformans var. grubii C23]|eukprot:XP_012053136.1 hypothetical protein CNAG_06104 [Cryptococcus neoformans var. grubii H99]